MSAEKKSENLLLRLTPTDKKNVAYHANLLGISLNEYIARCIRLKRIVICENFPALIYHLGKIGTNINQIAAIANKNEYISVSNVEEVERLMKDCYGMFEELLNYIYENENVDSQNSTNNISEILTELNTSVKMMNRRLQKIEKQLDC